VSVAFPSGAGKILVRSKLLDVVGTNEKKQVLLVMRDAF
jgi:hypothetical protein